MEHLKASSSPIPFSGAAWFDPLEEAVRFQFAGSSKRWWRRNCGPRLAGAAGTNARAHSRAIATATGSGSLSEPSASRGFRCRAPG